MEGSSLVVRRVKLIESILRCAWLQDGSMKEYTGHKYVISRMLTLYIFGNQQQSLPPLA